MSAAALNHCQDQLFRAHHCGCSRLKRQRATDEMITLTVTSFTLLYFLGVNSRQVSKGGRLRTLGYESVQHLFVETR